MAVGPLIVTGRVDQRMPHRLEIAQSLSIQVVGARIPQNVTDVDDEPEIGLAELSKNALERALLNGRIGRVPKRREAKGARRGGRLPLAGKR